eukprot:6272019-Pyramimonas_sp.AAC.1
MSKPFEPFARVPGRCHPRHIRPCGPLAPVGRARTSKSGQYFCHRQVDTIIVTSVISISAVIALA